MKQKPRVPEESSEKGVKKGSGLAFSQKIERK
jgi:hypothetical protein